MKTLRLLCLLGLAMEAAGAAGLTVEWRRYLGPWLAYGYYTSVACPDGTYYLSDARGAVTVVSADGGVLAHRTDIPEFRGGRLAACGPDGLLYVSLGRSGVLGLLDPGRGRRFDVVSRFDTPVSMWNLAFGPGGRMFVAGVRRGSDLAVHAIDARGRVLYSFGPSASAFIVPRRPPEGFVFPLEGGRVVFVERAEYVMRIYTEAGQPTGVRRRPELSDRFTRYVVRGAAALPEGGFAVCACNVALREVGEPACVADLYGPDAGYQDTVPAPPDVSLLAAGPDRTLYFTSIGPRGITVVKAKIKKPGREVYRADRARITTLD